MLEIIHTISRHLADRWEKEYAAPHHTHPYDRTPTVLETIEHLVLLDLLGAEKPLVSSYYLPTGWLFDLLVSAESRLDKAGLSGFTKKKAKASSGAEKKDLAKEKHASSFFRAKNTQGFGWIEDDHIPFLQRGVSVLHIITNPFPRVWHTIKVCLHSYLLCSPALITCALSKDDASALHGPTMKKWNLIMRIFTAEYLGLKPEVKLSAPSSKKSADLVSNPISPTIPSKSCIDQAPLSRLVAGIIPFSSILSRCDHSFSDCG